MPSTISPEESNLFEKAYRALDGCKDGKVTEALKECYSLPYRDKVPWGLFPAWARPNDPVECCHEG